MNAAILLVKRKVVLRKCSKASRAHSTLVRTLSLVHLKALLSSALIR